jgi:DNA polymerase-1
MTDTISGKRLVVIDGKSVFYRGYYAMPNLATKEGTPTGGVFGFATMALEVIRRLKPEYVAVAWDKPKTNIRKRLALYPQYKAGRKPAPPDFYEQIPILHEVLAAFGWPLYQLDDYEADDIMGTLAVQARERGLETLLVTSDLDMLQLINEQVKVYALKTGLSNIELYSPETFEVKYGLKVEQFLDLKSLKGDSSDNIPGVPGIGEKTAIQLLQTYKTLDGVYENVSLVKESVRKKLEAGKQLAYLSKEIGRIWTDAPLAFDLHELDGSKLQPATILELFEKLEFRSLARQLPNLMQTAIDGHKVDIIMAKQPKIGKTVFIDSPEKLKQVHIPHGEYLFVASLTSKKQGGEPLVLALSYDGLMTYSFDLTKLPYAEVLALLKPGTPLVGYDVKATLKMLLSLGATQLSPVRHDVLVGAFLLNGLRREQSLSELAQADLQYQGAAFDDLLKDNFLEHVSEMVAVIRALYEKQDKDLRAIPKLIELTRTIEWPVIPVLAGMEYEGIQLHVRYLRQMSHEIDGMISDIEKQIHDYAGAPFNVGSPAQLASVLFDPEYLGLSPNGIKKGKTGYSTAATELDKLRDKHPIIDLISQWREVTKLKNTYVDTLPQLVDEHSRLHTTFNLTIAQTGRLSSVDPNLQNIPVRTELGKRIRTAFVAGPGKKLVSADYSQFELRLSAAMSNDQGLIDMFNRDMDIHTATAALVYGRKPEDVTKQMRHTAKAVNFGIIYGMSTHGLVAATGMGYEQANGFIKDYMAIRKPLVVYLDALKEGARRDGYVETLFGRRRPMPDIHSSNFVIRSAAERAAMNMPIQGTEADLMKLAAIRVDKLLKDINLDCKQLLQIHDSILVECPESYADQVAKVLKETMEKVYPSLPVKLTVDTTIGDNWGEL